MDKIRAVGAGVLTTGFVGYVAGVYIDYPGRSFSITAVMVGIAVVAIGRGSPPREEA